MKKLILLGIFLSTIFINNAGAVSYVGNPRMVPNNYTIGYNQGYNIGYNKGKNDHAETVAKTVGAVFLIGVGVLVIYELAKPSQNNPGQVQLMRF